MPPIEHPAQSRRERLAGYRYELGWAVVATLLALAACFVPLLDVLGYESAELFCLFATTGVAAIALKRLGDGTVALGRDGAAESASRLVSRGLIPLLPPPLILLVNALRVPNCDVSVGLALYVLLPVASAVVVVAIAMAVGSIFRRTRWRIVAYVTVILASVVSSVAHILTEPPIYAFHPTIGYFAGSIYDEALEIPDGLLAFRLMSLAFVGVVLSGLAIGLRRRAGRPLGGAVLVLLASAGVWTAIYADRFELRLEADSEDIAEALGGRFETEHFVIHYPLAAGHIADIITAVAEDHEYRYAQLSEFFGVAPVGPLHSYLYASSAQKARYMGAGRTLIAKPWQGAMHLTYGGPGDGHLTHEMAHLFSAAFGSGPLRTSGGGLLHINMGLIEGAAEAAAWDGVDLTNHGWSAALYELDLAPRLADVLSAAGFWTRQSRTVYTLMGSFSRWLIDQRGAEAFRRLYATGDFEEAYGVSMDELLAGWRAFIEGLPLEADHLELARFRFDRPTIFGRPCARSLAARTERARALAGARRYEDAAECLRAVVADDPSNLSYALELADVLRDAGEYDEADSVAAEVTNHPDVGRVVQARARELRGDIAWSHGDRQAARAHYGAVADEPLSDDDLRRVSIKLWSVDDAEVGDVVFSLFLESPPRPESGLTLLLAEREAATHSPILAYLLGIRLYNDRAYEPAVAYLDAALERSTDAPAETHRGVYAVRRFAELRRAQALYFLGEYAEAEPAFRSLADSADVRFDARAAEGLDWADRVAWTVERRRAGRGSLR